MATKAPRIQVLLQADRILYLSKKARFSLVILITLDSEKPITIVKHDGDLDVGLVDRLIAQGIKYIDTESREEVPVLTVPTSNKSTRQSFFLMTLYNKRSDHLTFTKIHLETTNSPSKRTNCNQIAPIHYIFPNSIYHGGVTIPRNPSYPTLPRTGNYRLCKPHRSHAAPRIPKSPSPLAPTSHSHQQ